MLKSIFNFFKDSKAILPKAVFLLIAVVILTTTDLIVKQIVYVNMRNKTEDITVIPRFWSFHYQINDDIGFSALRWVDKYFKLPVKIKKSKFEDKILTNIDSKYTVSLLKDYYKLDKNNEYYVLIDNVEDYDVSMLKETLSEAGYKSSKWFFLVCLQGLGTVIVVLFFFNSYFWRYLIPLGLIVCGALGNVLDRIIRGYVVDFVMWNFWFLPDWKIFAIFKPWPIFNLADVFTVIGAVSLVIIMFLFAKEEVKDKIPEQNQS